jgi:hypothetical protein
LSNAKTTIPVNVTGKFTVAVMSGILLFSKSPGDTVKLMRSLMSSFYLFLVMIPSVFADNGPVSPKLIPVEIHCSTLFGLQYSLDDSWLLNHGDFEALISPLRDQEANRLLKKSESSAAVGTIFRLLGFAGALTGATGLLTGSANEHTGFLLTAIGGGLCVNIGGLFQSESQSAKFNCVQRYNRFARGEEQILPEAPSDERSLLDFEKPKGVSEKEVPLRKK